MKLIIQYLKTGKLKLADARTAAKEFLALLPFKDKDDLKSKLQDFTGKHKQFNQVYITFLKVHEEIKTAEMIAKMREYIRENKIDEALQLVR